MGVRSGFVFTGRVVNDVISFIVFTFLDLSDALLCFVYKLVDYVIESEWKPCYCSSSSPSFSPKDVITNGGKILVSENGGSSKVVSLSSSNKLHLEEISDTLYSRPSLVSDLSRSAVDGLRKLKLFRYRLTTTTTFTINSTIVQMLHGKIHGHGSSPPSPRWSDCGCKACNSSSPETLFVRAQCPKDGRATEEDVLFIHGFISSSQFWTETVFPNLSEEAKARHRLFAVDLLGFGRSPKPNDSLYTLREHVEMIERSVLEQYKVKSFHIVAHSLGTILALALAVKYPAAVKSLTLLAPPYFPVAKGECGTQYVLRKVAPRRVWPVIALGASVACWYEHLGRTVCLVLCKHHRIWELAFKLVTFNRVRTYLMDGFFCHTHNASWHTLHNIICGSAGKIDHYLDIVRDQLKCDVTVYHGRDDDLLPIHCSYAVGSKIPRARVKIVDNKDHVTILVGRQKAFARELEKIWKSTNC
ncbi:probable lysophospholipase BODYGUARD 3 [Typha latifolia]|uniref:probable lysophospholipase BODYGUARD 3 n=1 Tax=Typha latifolia TaxID=4733 RepID=UPI003C30B70D